MTETDPFSSAVRSTRALAPMHVLADRAAGMFVGLACGDALGVTYEFASPRLTGTPHMRGGGMGSYDPGEFSDETQLAICVAEVAVTGVDATTEEALDSIAERYIAWLTSGQREVDSQTRVIFDHVLADDVPGRPAQKMRRAAAYFHRRTGRSSGAAVLPRVAILGLSHVDDAHWTAESVRAVAELTHVDPLAGDACVLVADALRRAVCSQLEGAQYWTRRLDLERGIDLLPRSRQDQWRGWLHDGKEMFFKPPLDNTFVVAALQACVGAITEAALDAHRSDCADFGVRRAVENAVRVGGDTDTIAAVTGALVGAAVGAARFPKDWVRTVHGWPGFRADALTDFAVGTMLAGLVGPQAMSQALASGLDFSQLAAACVAGDPVVSGAEGDGPPAAGAPGSATTDGAVSDESSAGSQPQVIIIEP